MNKTRVLVADDSAFMRQTLKRIIAESEELELAGVARDGEDAVAKARELRPDVVSMDINMPKLDGIGALQTIVQEKICPVVMVSCHTQHGATITFECLELGAFDFVGKPDGEISSNMAAVAREVVAKLKAAASAGSMAQLGRHRERRHGQGAAMEARFHNGFEDLAKAKLRGEVESRAVAIGISTGGPATLQEVLPLIPPDLPASLFLVQHMPASFMPAFAKRLGENCALKVVVASPGLAVEPGVCYVAPGGLHLCVHRKLTGEVVIRTPAAPKTLFMPSVGVMMNSVLKVYGKATIGVLMTGIGDDGANEMVAIRQAGGYTIAESQETAVVYGMPREAYERGGAAVLLPSYEVAGEIVRTLRGEVA
jgi:two-component system chemotaxis response regulator CheB